MRLNFTLDEMETLMLALIFRLPHAVHHKFEAEASQNRKLFCELNRASQQARYDEMLARAKEQGWVEE